jgi:hypothetical protein
VKLYAICWQDPTEPWGWSPAVGPAFMDFWGAEDRGPKRPFYWDRGEAESELDALVAVSSEWDIKWSVQEYDVPIPPRLHDAALQLFEDGKSRERAEAMDDPRAYQRGDGEALTRDEAIGKFLAELFEPDPSVRIDYVDKD